MSKKDLYLAVKARILEKCPTIKHIGVYNNQFELVENQQGYSFPFPCAFVQILSPSQIKQLGNGVQMYEPMIVRIHIGDDYYNNYEDGQQEENLRIFDLCDEMYAGLQKFTPDQAGTFIRVEEDQDFDHTNVYHMIQDYETNYIDNVMNEPVGGTVGEPPFTLVVEPTYIIPQHGKP